MKARSLLVFGAGYVLGTRAGRERYAQIAKLAGRAATRLREVDLPVAEGEPTVRLADYVASVADGTRR